METEAHLPSLKNKDQYFEKHISVKISFGMVFIKFIKITYSLFFHRCYCFELLLFVPPCPPRWRLNDLAK